MANTYELIVKTVDRSTKPLKNIEKSLAQLDRRSKAVNNTLKGVGAALVAVVAARGLKAVIDVTARFEDLNTSLATVTGSAQKGAQAFDFIQGFASKTAFSVEDLTQTYIKLQGAGITPTTKLLQTFSDSVSTSTDRLGALQAITDLFARSTAGGLGLEDLNRLADRGIPVFDILQQKMGLARLQIGEFGKTADGAAQILKNLTEGLDERFGGATERTLGNLSVLISNLGDATDRALASFGEGMSPALKEVVEGLTKFINANDSLFRSLGEGAGEVIRGLANSVKSLADTFGLLDPGALERVFGNLLIGLGTFIQGFQQATAQIITAFSTISNAIAGFQDNTVVLEVGVTREERIEELKSQLTLLATTGSNVQRMLKFGPFGGLAANITTTRMLNNELTALEDPATNVYNKIDTGAIQGAASNTTLSQSLIDIGEQMKANAAIAAGDTVDYQGRGQMYEKIGERANYLATQERLLAQATIDHANAQEQLVMTQQVVSTGASEMSIAYDELIAKTNSSIEAGNVNDELLRRVTQAYKLGWLEIDQYKTALQNLGISLDENNVKLSEYQKFLNGIKDAATAEAAQTGFAIQAKATLREELNNGLITLDAYAIAMERINGILGVSTTATTTLKDEVATVASTYRDATEAIDAFNLKQTNTSGALSKLEGDFKGGKINLEQFKVGMNSMGAEMKNVSDKSIVMGMTITDAFTSAGDSLASGLAQGIMRGEGIMNSFKGFMSSILETILTQIIQQAFIGPLISSMTSGLGQAFSAFGAGGAGAFGGGGFGSMIGGSLFGPIGGMLGGLLGFADGGVVPGRATSGDSIPAMLTPGEVILNKGQQAAVMSNNNNEPVTVNFNMNTIDSRSGTEFILQNKQQITSVIQQAYNTRGQSGPLG